MWYKHSCYVFLVSATVFKSVAINANSWPKQKAERSWVLHYLCFGAELCICLWRKPRGNGYTTFCFYSSDCSQRWQQIVAPKIHFCSCLVLYHQAAWNMVLSQPFFLSPQRVVAPPCQLMCSFKKVPLSLTFSPWLCAAGICELVCPASASQRGWGWILWAECWRAAPAPSSASLPAGAPSSAAPTDVPGKQTTTAKERPCCSARDTVVLSSATMCPRSFRLTQSLCFRASSSAVELSLGDSSEVIFFSICAQIRTWSYH